MSARQAGKRRRIVEEGADEDDQDGTRGVAWGSDQRRAMPASDHEDGSSDDEEEGEGVGGQGSMVVHQIGTQGLPPRIRGSDGYV